MVEHALDRVVVAPQQKEAEPAGILGGVAAGAVQAILQLLGGRVETMNSGLRDRGLVDENSTMRQACVS